MRIDFEVFAALTAAIAGCAPQPEPKPAPRYFDSTESSGAVATALPAPTDTTPPEPVGTVPRGALLDRAAEGVHDVDEIS